MTEKQLFYPLLSVYFSLILGDLQKEKLQIVSIFRFGHKKRGLFQCPQRGGIGRGYMPYYIYRRRHIRFAIRWWSRLGENGISCCLFLHQTTTMVPLEPAVTSCISSVSYIKPQLIQWIEPDEEVVYRPFPTSNHNPLKKMVISNELYIVRFLHQTTTISLCIARYESCISSVSYIKPQL